MKKTLINSLLVGLVVLIVAALFVYFYISLNRMDKRLIAVQTAISQDSTKITAIVNFFNSNLNAQTNQTTK